VTRAVSLNRMALLKNILLVTHFLGLAALIGGWIATRMGSAALPLVVWGARIQLLTGLLLVGIIEMADLGDLNHMKIGVKLLVTIAAVGAAEVAAAKARRNEPNSTLVDAAGALGVLNVLVATLWKVYS